MNSYCGFIAIVGRPNVGKSTLLNHLIGEKISITSNKPQTTRYRVLGINSTANTQYIFIDTPGFQQKYLNKLNSLLNESVKNSISQADIMLCIVEFGQYTAADRAIFALLPIAMPVILVINKADTADSTLELTQFNNFLNREKSFTHTVYTSAKHHRGIDELLEATKPFLPASEFLYPADQITDKNCIFLTSEIIREKLFRYLGKELPYNLAVEIEHFTEEPTLTKITAKIIAAHERYKAIIIGKAGVKLHKIATESRIDIEKMLKQKVYLHIWVVVKSGFADELSFLQQLQ